jgi:hypothetical protein
MYSYANQPNVKAVHKQCAPARKHHEGVVQRKAFIKTRPLGQKEGEDSKDWNIGFGNLKYNHRHLIFDHKHPEIAAKSSTNHQDNIGFHAKDKTKGIQGGTGELFGENVQNYGYTQRAVLDDENTAVKAVEEIPCPAKYNLITNNCQDYVSSVVKKYNQLKEKTKASS